MGVEIRPVSMKFAVLDFRLLSISSSQPVPAAAFVQWSYKAALAAHLQQKRENRQSIKNSFIEKFCKHIEKGQKVANEHHKRGAERLTVRMAEWMANEWMRWMQMTEQQWKMLCRQIAQNGAHKRIYLPFYLSLLCFICFHVHMCMYVHTCLCSYIIIPSAQN